MEETAVTEKIVRYQRYLVKCVNDDKFNEKQVRKIPSTLHALDVKAELSNNSLMSTGKMWPCLKTGLARPVRGLENLLSLTVLIVFNGIKCG